LNQGGDLVGDLFPPAVSADKCHTQYFAARQDIRILENP
jgi:hypothetical protein